MEQSTQLYVFIGENSFTLAEEVRRWKSQFLSKYGAENLVELSGADASEEVLLDAISVSPFIAERRLVICHGIPRLERDAVRRVVQEIHPQTLLLIEDSAPDKRLSSTKEFMSIAEESSKQHMKTFPLLKRPQLIAWIRARFLSLRCTIDDASIAHLLDIVGEDQWFLASEIEKLSFVGPVITLASIDTLVVPSGEQVIWKLSDILGNQNIAEAQAFYRKCIDRGQDPYDLWIALLTFIKNLAAVWICLQSGVADARSIAESTKLHPFVVPKILPMAKYSDAAFIQSILDLAVRFDVGLKTGGYHVTVDRPQEIIVITERMILACHRC